MEIIKKSVESKDRMYCSSTGEILFSPDMPEVNDDTKAFIAYWHNEVLDQPEIKDPELAAAWEEFFEKNGLSWMKKCHPERSLQSFLKNIRMSNGWCMNVFSPAWHAGLLLPRFILW